MKKDTLQILKLATVINVLPTGELLAGPLLGGPSPPTGSAWEEESSLLIGFALISIFCGRASSLGRKITKITSKEEDWFSHKCTRN